jgi:hypothetical protein
MDKTVDFKSFKTFYLLPWDHSVSSTVSLIARNKLRDAMREEMEKRGYRFVDSGGDLAVGASVLIEEMIEYRSDGHVNHHMGWGGMGWGGGAWGMHPGMGMHGMGMMGPGMGMGMGWTGPTTVRPEKFKNGSLILDVYDGKQKRLIWQAVGTDRLNNNKDKERKRIPSYVKLLFRRYPVEKVK